MDSAYVEGEERQPWQQRLCAQQKLTSEPENLLTSDLSVLDTCRVVMMVKIAVLLKNGTAFAVDDKTTIPQILRLD